MLPLKALPVLVPHQLQFQRQMPELVAAVCLSTHCMRTAAVYSDCAQLLFI